MRLPGEKSHKIYHSIRNWCMIYVL